MKRALERHEAKEAIVLPVILRPCQWEDAPFAKLQATPKNGTPVTMLPNRDQAFLDVANTIKAAAKRLGGASAAPPSVRPVGPRTMFPSARQPAGPRSSNLAVAKHFSQRDKDAFQLETFEYIARYFENSAGELERRNPGVQSTFRRIDANRFSTVIYKDGQPVSRCTIFMGDRPFVAGIAYAAQESSGNGYNEALNVEADDRSLFLRSMGMASIGRGRGGEESLTQEGAAELYWEMLMRPLQHGGRPLRAGF